MANPQHWFFLRGLARESGHWGAFVPRFRAAFPEGQLHLIDLPGTGSRHLERSPRTVEQIAEAVASSISLEAFPGERYIFTISLGGMVGLSWCQLRPGAFQGLVLINTSLGGLSPFYDRVSPEVLPSLARIFLSSSLDQREERVLELTSQKKEWAPALLAERVELARRHPMSRKNFMRQLFAASRYLLPESPPDVNLLVLNSLGDHLVHPRCSEAIAAHWRLPLERHPWAGHDLPLDDPEWVIEKVKLWLTKS